MKTFEEYKMRTKKFNPVKVLMDSESFRDFIGEMFNDAKNNEDLETAKEESYESGDPLIKDDRAFFNMLKKETWRTDDWSRDNCIYVINKGNEIEECDEVPATFNDAAQVYVEFYTVDGVHRHMSFYVSKDENIAIWGEEL